MSFAAIDVIECNLTFRTFKALIRKNLGFCAVTVINNNSVAQLEFTVACPCRVTVIVTVTCIVKVIPTVSEPDTRFGAALAMGKAVRYYETLRESKQILDYKFIV